MTGTANQPWSNVYLSGNAAELVLQSLSCERGARLLFEGIDQRLAAGEGLRVSGTNGSGKTSLLRIVAGLTSEFSGDVIWNGASTRALGPSWRANLLYLGHSVGVKAALTPRENLSWWAELHEGRATAGEAATEADEALANFGLAHYLDIPCARLSAGQQRRVALARLCLARHAVWVLDEPATALDRAGVLLIEQLCAAHLQRGGILLLTTHQPLAIPGLVELDLDCAVGVQDEIDGADRGIDP